MNSNLKVTFYLKKNEIRLNETCPVMGRIWIGKQMVRFSCKLTVRVDLWDAKSGRCLGKSNLAVSLNRELDKINVSICSHFRELVERFGINEVSPLALKQAFQGFASSQDFLLAYFERHNQEFARRVGVNREKSTHQGYCISYKFLSEFIHSKLNLSDISFLELNLAFIEKYDFYLRVELTRMPNTVLEKMRHLRKMIKFAIQEGILWRDPFEGYSPERPKAKQKYLTRAELELIMTTPLDHPNRYLTRDLFLFSCFCGLAFQDMCNLTYKQIVRADDGQLWIKTTRQKTGTPCNIPLLDIPLQIMAKYKGLASGDKVLLMLSCGRLNLNLKKIGKICGIDKRLIFHMGRHTYASEICLSQGVPIETVSQMLGHRDLRSTQIYAKISNDKIDEDVTALQTRIASKYTFVGTVSMEESEEVEGPEIEKTIKDAIVKIFI